MIRDLGYGDHKQQHGEVIKVTMPFFHADHRLTIALEENLHAGCTFKYGDTIVFTNARSSPNAGRLKRVRQICFQIGRAFQSDAKAQ